MAQLRTSGRLLTEGRLRGLAGSLVVASVAMACQASPKYASTERLIDEPAQFRIHLGSVREEAGAPGGQLSPFAISKIAVGSDHRDAIVVPRDSELCTEVEPQEGAELRFGYSIASGEWSEKAELEFRIDIQAGSTESTVFTGSLGREETALQAHWVDASVALGGYVGQQITLCLVSSGTHESADRVAWANPSIVYPRNAGERNLILISLDTLRADVLNSYGYDERVTTPHIDKLASAGARFEQAFANAPWTTPSHMSIFTSLYPSAHGLDAPINNRMRRANPDLLTLAKILRSNGYSTVSFNAGGAVSAELGFADGFDIYSSVSRGRGPDLETVFHRTTEWLRSNHEQKFFLFIHTYEPHQRSTHPVYSNSLHPDRNEPSVVTRAGYDGDVWFTDLMMGLLFQMLRDLDLMEHSVIVLLSDHGENLHDRMEDVFPIGHGYHLYREMLQVPLILVSEGQIPAGLSIDVPVELVDVLPTALTLLGIEEEFVKQGQDLTPLFSPAGASNMEPKEFLFAEATTYGPARKALRSKRFKFILSFGEDPDAPILIDTWDLASVPERELFDLREDPEERTNVLQRFPEVAAEMERRLMEQMAADEALNANIGATTIDLDAELLRRLRALGYIR